MSNWRPNDWERVVLGWFALYCLPTPKQTFEAGADAMYQPAYNKGWKDCEDTLKAHGEFFNNVICLRNAEKIDEGGRNVKEKGDTHGNLGQIHS